MTAGHLVPRSLTVAITASALAAFSSAVTAIPQFVTRVDLAIVDTQVTDRTGQPIRDLRPDELTVTIDGKNRRVIGVTRIEYDGRTTPDSDLLSRRDSAGLVAPEHNLSSEGHLFVVAIDCTGMTGSLSRSAAGAASQFARGLRPHDRLGLFAYPLGPKIDPSTDHDHVLRALDTMSCSGGAPTGGRYNLRPSDIVDMMSHQNRSSAGRDVCGGDRACIDEARGLAQYYEAEGPVGFRMLTSLFRNLSPIEARKTVVLLTAGIPMSDTPGGRPDFGSLPIMLGEEAARANTALYTIFIDRTSRDRNAAETRSAPKNLVSLERDVNVLTRAVDQFTGAAGGTLIKDMLGEGGSAFQWVLSETSAYYLIGVEPEVSDRDGKRHEIRVKVRRPGVSVTNRRWVVVPK